MTILRPFIFLALLAGLALGAPALRAQEPAGHAQPAHEAKPEGHEAKPEGHEAKPEGHEAKPEGHEAKAEGHEGHAAAGEGHGGAHHAPFIFMGKELGKAGQFGIQLFNFALFAGLLVFLLKGALSSAFKARAKELEDKLSQAERERAEADAQIRELEARMAGLQAELAGIMAKAETDAEAEKERILASASAEAAAIIAQSHAEIEFQKRAAEADLRTLVAELAIEGATKRLQNQVTGDVAAQVLDRSIQQVGGAQ
jgi:F-type H+-transporting ATPase subunit b